MINNFTNPLHDYYDQHDLKAILVKEPAPNLNK